MTFWMSENDCDKISVNVPLVEAAACVASDATLYHQTTENVLDKWKRFGRHLDAYIRRDVEGIYRLRIRYGSDSESFFEIRGDQRKLDDLYSGYTQLTALGAR